MNTLLFVPLSSEQVVRRATVEEVLIEEDCAVGVRVKMDGSSTPFEVKAGAVVCNADLWNTMKLIPPGKSTSFDGMSYAICHSSRSHSLLTITLALHRVR